MRKVSTAANAAGAILILAALFAMSASVDAQSDLSTLVGKWVWKAAPNCPKCLPFTVVLTFSSVARDGTVSGTYQSPAAPNGVKVAPRATFTDGKIKVALKVGKVDFDLSYSKSLDALRGPVTGFSPQLMIQDASFIRDK